MPNYGYSIFGLDPDRTAIASARELDISPKAAREICNTIKGMFLDRAKEYLEDVSVMKKAVPYRRHKKHVAHRKELSKWPSGRYPIKAAKKILEVLENAENNAEFKGLDVERMKIIHAASQKGMIIKRFFPRAQGSSSPKYNYMTHIEIAIEEV
ncbi:MAG: 50S ribosomal protein L22 [Asgard group archaeon]|nr:50S ribosomal protein L22 [Asgard group archaeon]